MKQSIGHGQKPTTRTRHAQARNKDEDREAVELAPGTLNSIRSSSIVLDEVARSGRLWLGLAWLGLAWPGHTGHRAHNTEHSLRYYHYHY